MSIFRIILSEELLEMVKEIVNDEFISTYEEHGGAMLDLIGESPEAQAVEFNDFLITTIYCYMFDKDKVVAGMNDQDLLELYNEISARTGAITTYYTDTGKYGILNKELVDATLAIPTIDEETIDWANKVIDYLNLTNDFNCGRELALNFETIMPLFELDNDITTFLKAHDNMEGMLTYLIAYRLEFPEKSLFGVAIDDLWADEVTSIVGVTDGCILTITKINDNESVNNG